MYEYALKAIRAAFAVS